MADPWEKYQAPPSDGPWSNYAPSKPERGLLGRTADWLSGANHEENIAGSLEVRPSKN